MILKYYIEYVRYMSGRSGICHQYVKSSSEMRNANVGRMAVYKVFLLKSLVIFHGKPLIEKSVSGSNMTRSDSERLLLAEGW